MDTWIELTSWNMVCHRTMATIGLTDWGLQRFVDEYEEYFIALSLPQHVIDALPFFYILIGLRIPIIKVECFRHSTWNYFTDLRNEKFPYLCDRWE